MLTGFPCYHFKTFVFVGDKRGGYTMKYFMTGMFLLVLPVFVAAQDWVEHTVDDEFFHAVSVFATDVDGDGDTDVIGAAFDDDDITWWENADGSGTSWIEHTVDIDFNGANEVYAMDVDGDGDTDILGAAFHADAIKWWENSDGTGTSWTVHTVAIAFQGAHSVYAMDVDSDGDTDVLGAAAEDDQILWWENIDGDGTAWDNHVVAIDYNYACSVTAADVDGDGDTDVLGTARLADDITWWENTDGDGTAWTEHTVEGDFNGARSVHAVDVDGDGDIDMLGAADVADDITWWENADGAGTSWIEHIVDGDFDGAYSVYATDVDGDGDMDVLGACQNDYEITWWENADGEGTAWTEHNVDDDFTGARDVYAADMDGDGDTDVLGAAWLADSITWWEQPGPQQDPVVVTLTPTSGTNLPAAGGTLHYDINIVSTLPGNYTGLTVWTKVKLPNGQFYPQIQFQTLFTLLPFMEATGSLTQDIPAFAPAGEYEMWGWIGMNPNGGGPQFGGYFPFTKDAALAGGNEVTGWAGEGLFDVEPANNATKPLPTEYELLPVYPNPFNPSTMIAVSLPETAELNVTVYNVMGQQVAELVRGSVDAGTHTFTLDGSNLASGMYFVRATVPGQMDQVQKVMLVR